MLINKGYDKGDIATFKMINGEEVIAEVLSLTDSGWMVKDPYSLAMTQQGLQVVPSMFSADNEKEVPIQKAHVLMHGVTKKDAKSVYIQQVTGLVVASAGQGIVT